MNDEAVLRAAQAIYEEINGEYWTDATPQQQRDYIHVARVALINAGVGLAENGANDGARGSLDKAVTC